jgi:protein SCO1/2
VAVGALLGLAACERLPVPSASRVAAFRGIDITGAPYARTLNLTDQHGQARSLADFRGRVVLLFFGFVQCPDVCPTALARASEVMQGLGADAQRVQLLFVTLDPERDTPAMLREYMAAFDPSFLALTGSMDEIRAAASEFRVFFRHVPTGSSYTVDHSAMTYLIDPRGQPRVVLRHEQSVDDYTHDVRLLLHDDPGRAATPGLFTA